MNKNPIIIEKAVDLLFQGSQLKAAVIRMLCKEDELSPESMSKIKETISNEFPKELKSIGHRFSEMVQSLHRSLREHFDQETSSKIRMVEKAASGKTAYFVGDFPIEMVRTGRLSNVRDIEVFAPDGLSVDGIIVHTLTPSASIVPYMKLLNIDDTPFNRFALSRGISADAVGIRVGTNEVLDPTNTGISDILAGKVSPIFHPNFVYENIPEAIFRAIRLAGRDGMSLNAGLRDCISNKSGIRVPAERLLVEMATLSKHDGTRKVLEDLGLEA